MIFNPITIARYSHIGRCIVQTRTVPKDFIPFVGLKKQSLEIQLNKNIRFIIDKGE